MYNSVNWSKRSNVYEVNIRQYTAEGTFKAFSRHLPRLKDMGVEILWLMPVTPISKEKRLGSLGSYYACSSYVLVNPEFGSHHDFKDLVNAVHTAGMKIIIDWVANHTGWDHEWTVTHPDWYIKDTQGNFTEKNNWADVIDLNYGNEKMQKEMIRSMQFWLNEFDIDGFRCDMAHLVPLDFWNNARRQCEKIKKLFWLAECDVERYHEVFDVSYAWSWMHLSERIMRYESSIGEMKQLVLKQYSAIKKLYFTSNHDENSWNGTEYEKYGNASKAMAVLTCTLPGMPLVYSGQELPNKKRLAFFEKDLIAWGDCQPLLHDFYKNLFYLRKNNKAFDDDATFEFLTTNADDKVIAFTRSKGENLLLVIINISATSQLRVQINELIAGSYSSLLTGLSYRFENRETFEMQAWQYFVYYS